jgi:2-polyprenyl-3-methyl-5-hydroxy-6-metoxy-1,4-benzoquinol methylase
MKSSSQLSWNLATVRHNAHKKNQASFFRKGGTTLFPEERALLGDLQGKSLLHLQCNAGQDSLSLARLGAKVTGVDWSDEAIGFARRLSAESHIPAEFIQSEAVSFVTQTAPPETYDVVFFSYGVLGWVRDIRSYFRGMARVLKPGGRLVAIEFHPLVWCFDENLKHIDSYETSKTYVEGVGDYVNEAQSPSGFLALEEPFENPHSAEAWQHTLGQMVSAMCQTGLQLTDLQEYPFANGFRPWPTLPSIGKNRFGFREGAPNFPLMFSMCATRA